MKTILRRLPAILSACLLPLVAAGASSPHDSSRRIGERPADIQRERLPEETREAALGTRAVTVDAALEETLRSEAANDEASVIPVEQTESSPVAGTPVPGLALSAPAPIGEPSREEHPIHIVSVPRLEAAAQAILSAGRFAFMGPSGEGWTYSQNRSAFGDFPIMPKRLQGVRDTDVDLSTTLLGHKLPLPIITCPTGSQGWLHANQELPNAKAAGEVGTIFTASGASNKSMEEIAAATQGPHWFQIYMNRDMSLNRELVHRARAAGYTAIVLTADGLGRGESDDYIALGRPIPPGLTFGNHDPARGGRGNFPDFKPDISFDDIDYLRQESGLPVILKGILRPEDAEEAVRHGAAAVWVSNHGGRQMDGGPATMHALKAVVDAVAGRVPVIVDSGFRRGSDVFKALALGATAVAIGRPALWGLITGGSEGVKAVYNQFAAELKQVMRLSGVARVVDLTREFLAKY